MQSGPDDCFSACLASVMELPLEAVPKFFEIAGKDETEWWKAIKAWLATHGWGVINIDCNAFKLRRIDGYLIVAGESARGVDHSTVWHKGKLVHDPHPEQNGIKEPRELDLLYPLDPAKMRLKESPVSGRHVGDFDAYVQDEREKSARQEAEGRVLAVRGSHDAPGFEACVEAEMVNIAEENVSREPDSAA
ncbi:MAG: hypothetical protein K8U57_35905 [Planctomycetes bacterium]|nr:hypothetical protein [Planctomycetota bacterium]